MSARGHATWGGKWESSSHDLEQAQQDKHSHLFELTFCLSTSRPPHHIQWFIFLKHERMYYVKFTSTTMVKDKCLDFKSFNYLFFRLEEWFKYPKWDKLVQSEKQIYPHLWHMFYTNLTDTHLSIEILVKGVKIILISNTLVTILRIPCESTQLTVCIIWLETPSSPLVLSDILGRQINYINFPFTFTC